jgi:hypothetical protein
VTPFIADALRADLNPGESARAAADFFRQMINQFEIVYSGLITNTGENTILFRENQPRQDPSRGWVRAYGLRNGVEQIHAEPDGNFENWEREHASASVAEAPKKWHGWFGKR